MGSTFKYKLIVFLLVTVLLCVTVFWWQPWRGHLSGGMSSWRWPKFVTRGDTVFVKGPVNYIDRWHERIQYVAQSPDTVQVVVYEFRPPTIEFVSGTVTDDGYAYIEFLVDSITAQVVQGQLTTSGETVIQPNIGGGVVFVHPRFGFDPALSGGAGIRGLQLSVETFYWNDVPLLNTTVHGPNVDLVGGWDWVRGDVDFDQAAKLGLSASAEVAPFRTTGRIGIGGVYDTETEKFGLNAYGELEIFNF